MTDLTYMQKDIWDAVLRNERRTMAKWAGLAREQQQRAGD